MYEAVWHPHQSQHKHGPCGALLCIAAPRDCGPMDDNNALLLDAALERLREIERVFDELNVGVAVLHLEATIAALESRIRKARSGEQPLGLRPRSAERAD